MDLRSSWPPETGYYMLSEFISSRSAVFSVLALEDGTAAITDGVTRMLLGREHSNWFFGQLIPADFNLEFTLPHLPCSQ